MNCGHNPPSCCAPRARSSGWSATATVLGLFEEWDCTVAGNPTRARRCAGDLHRRNLRSRPQSEDEESLAKTAWSVAIRVTPAAIGGRDARRLAHRGAKLQPRRAGRRHDADRGPRTLIVRPIYRHSRKHSATRSTASCRAAKSRLWSLAAPQADTSWNTCCTQSPVLPATSQR